MTLIDHDGVMACRQTRDLVSEHGARSAILSCTAEHEVESLIAEPLRRFGGGDGVTALFFRRMPDADIRLDAAYAAALPEDCQARYMQGFYTLDPMVQRHLRPALADPAEIAPVTPFLVEDLAALAMRGDEKYVEEFWRPFGLSHMAGLLIRPIGHPDHVVVLAVHRFRGAKPFGEADLDRLSRIGGAARLVSSLLVGARAERRAAEMAAALGRWIGGAGYAVLDAEGRLSFASPEAMRAWAEDPAKREEVVQGAVRRGQGVFYIGPEDDGLQIACQRNDETGETMILSGRIADDAAQRARAAAFGLSPRETDVAVSVARGLSNAETATLLGIAVRTVENHLRAVFDAVGVDNRTSLARMLMGGR